MLKNKEGMIRSGWKLLLTIFVLYVSIFVISSLLSLPIFAYFAKSGDYVAKTQYVSERAGAFFSYFTNAIQIILMILVPVLSWTKFSKQPVGAMGLKPFSLHKRELLAGLAAGFVSMTLVFTGIVLSKNAVILSWKPHFSADMIIWLLIFIGVGFAEEIFGRGYIMAILRQTRNKVTILLVSGVIFAMLHSNNPGVGTMAYVNLMLVGLLFAYSFMRSGNIWLCIGYHITWNLFEGLYGFPVSGVGTPSLFEMEYKSNTIWNGGAFGPEGGIFVTIVVLAGIFFVHHYYRNNNYEFLDEVPVKTSGNPELAATKETAGKGRH